MIHGVKRKGGAPHPGAQVDEIDNLGTFLLRFKNAPDLVDMPPSFITRIQTAEGEKLKYERIWDGMTGAEGQQA